MLNEKENETAFNQTGTQQSSWYQIDKINIEEVNKKNTDTDLNNSRNNKQSAPNSHAHSKPANTTGL